MASMFAGRMPRLGEYGGALRGIAITALVTILLAWPVAAQTPTPTPTPAPELPRTQGTEVVVSAPRIDVPLKDNPAATTVVTEQQLALQPKTIGADEALKLVPGVKVDNQAAGERVHMSIRGQGILTERGIRGIKVLLDGLPLNDPTGFAPDLFDVDWATVRRIEVLRGAASALYGGGGSGGVLAIETRDGGPGAVEGQVDVNAGSHGFWKGLTEVGGSEGRMRYRISASRMWGDGYRVHTAYQASNLYGKFQLPLGERGEVTAIVAGTSYFNENAEGLNIAQVEQDPRQPNPDALTFNEYQQTRRGTAGLVGRIKLAEGHDVSFAGYVRETRWREAVPSSVQHRVYDSPGGYLLYRWNSDVGGMRNVLSIGADLDWQGIDDSRRPNLGRAREGAEVLADQRIEQRGVAGYVLDRLELSPTWSLMAGVRHDDIDNELTDRLQLGGVDLSGDKSFNKTTVRAGAAWNPTSTFGAYVSWAQGFLPPATEELANNPAHLGGFNESLVPATSQGPEVGVRGTVGVLTYDVAVFRLETKDDFGRYRMPERPLETFYRNAGDSTRHGLEAALGWFPNQQLAVQLAYTYSHFRYDWAKYGNETFHDTYLPNSPKHQAYLDGAYRLGDGLEAGASVEAVSSWYIDPSNRSSVDGYTLLHLRLGVEFEIAHHPGSLLLQVRNVTGKKYIAFTEPDPDGNSYQPAPERELFGGVRVTF